MHCCLSVFSELLLKSYENHLQMASAARLGAPAPPPALQHPLAAFYSPAALAAAAAVSQGQPSPYSHLPPPLGGLGPFPGTLPGQLPAGSFQHLLATMSGTSPTAASPALKRRDEREAPPLPAQRDSPEASSSNGSLSPPASSIAGKISSVPLVENDRRSSSIAALRLRAREYEMKLGLGSKPNGMVY